MIPNLSLGDRGTSMSSRMTSRQLIDKLHGAGLSFKAADHAAKQIEEVVGQRYHEIPHNIREITRGLQNNKGEHLSDGDIRRVTGALTGK